MDGPGLARWLLGVGITATLAANVGHGWTHGPVGATVAAWPAIALVGSYELLMWLIRTQAPDPKPVSPEQAEPAEDHAWSSIDHAEPDVDHIAARAYQESVIDGSPLSERKLANQFGRSRRWARKIIVTTRETAADNNEGVEGLLARGTPYR